ncbi:MAG: hypothetical protein PVG49_14840 [Desulfobacteraceae bacterium]|jgi:hypothetical protein
MRSSTGKHAVFAGEILLFYGIVLFLRKGAVVGPELYYLLTAFVGLALSLYYGIRGMIGAAVGTAALLVFDLGAGVPGFLVHHYQKVTFFSLALLFTGFVTSRASRRVLGTELTNRILMKRLERLTIELSERDRALQDAFQEVLTDMESPRIMYQALRRLEEIPERDAFFNEILYILYTHCHVEKSSLFEPQGLGTFGRVASFGVTSLPDRIPWRAEEMPEILKVAATEQEVVIPKEIENRLVMAIPILSQAGDLRYILLVEEIRFINLSDNLINLLKIAAHWIKTLIENRLHLDDLLPMSAFPSVLVYKQEEGRRALARTITRYRRYGLPYATLRVTGPVTEESARNLSRSLRLYDMLVMSGEDEMILCLAMAANVNVPFVILRLSSAHPEFAFEEIEAQEEHAGEVP